MIDPRVTRWQPIETAPKDGTQVLIVFLEYGVGPGKKVAAARYFRKAWRDYLSDKMQYFEPTLWAPLPEPPA